MLSAPPSSPGKRLRQLIAAEGCVLLPGIFNGISALAAASVGARGLYLSGAGVSNSLGLPDIALLSLPEIASAAANVCQVSALPVIADADTGYGEAWNVARCVVEFERAGLAGLHVEDQVSPKRCGHLDGKSVEPTPVMVAKIRAALGARKDPSFLVIARTDARGVEGLESAIERGNAYVDAGADGVFPEGMESEEEFRRFREAVPGPLLANMTEFGKTPIIGFARFKELGYNLVIFPQTAFRVMLKSITDTYEELLREGDQRGLLGRMRTRKELYDLIDYDAYSNMDRDWSNA